MSLRMLKFKCADAYQLLTQNFGLEVFIMRRTIPIKFRKLLQYANSRDKPKAESFAFLVLPRKMTTQGLTEEDAGSHWNAQVDSSVGILTMIDIPDLMLKNEQKQRFSRAMSFFTLKPKLYQIQMLSEHDEEGPILTDAQKFNGVSAFEMASIRNRLRKKTKSK